MLVFLPNTYTQINDGSLTNLCYIFLSFFPLAYSAYHQTSDGLTDVVTDRISSPQPLTRCSLIHSQRTARSISEELASDNARCSDDLQKAEGSSGSHSSSKPDSAHKSDKDKDKKDKEKEERDEGKCVEHSHAALTFPHFHLLFLPCRKTMHFFGVVVRWMLCEWLRSETLLSGTLSGPLCERSASDEEWHSFQQRIKHSYFSPPFDLVSLPPISLMTFLFNF